MSYQKSSRLKLIIGAVLLVGVLGAGLVSIWNMDHVAMANHGCVGLNVGAPPCFSLVDVASCLRTHLGVVQAISQAVPAYVSQLFILLIVTAVLWFTFKRKRGEPDALSRLRLRWQNFTSNLDFLLKKIEHWLILHEKRDPAPATLVVFGALPVPIM